MILFAPFVAAGAIVAVSSAGKAYYKRRYGGVPMTLTRTNRR